MHFLVTTLELFSKQSHLRIKLIFGCTLGGGGGKGTWGKLCEEYDIDGRALDANDPNYDSDCMVSSYCLFHLAI